MKTQVLSHFESLENISIAHRLPSSYSRMKQENNLNLNSKLSFQRLSPSLKDPYQSAKLLSQAVKKPTRRFLVSLSKNNNRSQKTRTDSKQQSNNSLHFAMKTIKKGNQNKKQIIHKKFANNLKSDKTVSHNSISQLRNQNSEFAKESKTLNLLPRKQSTKLNHVNTIEEIKNKNQYIQEYNISEPKKQKICEKQQKHIKMKHLMRTMNLSKDYKQLAYFNLSNKKYQIKTQKNRPTQSLYRISSSNTEKQEDVSIQIACDQFKCQQQNFENGKIQIEIDCSQIKQKSVQNDSMFMQASQKALLDEINQESRRDERKKRVWKKLPNDFLKF